MDKYLKRVDEDYGQGSFTLLGKLKRKNTNFQTFSIRVDDPFDGRSDDCVGVCVAVSSNMRTHVGFSASQPI